MSCLSSAPSQRLLTKDLILRAERPSREPRLVSSKEPEPPGKDEQETSSDDLELAVSQELLRMPGRQHHGVTIELALRHDVTRTGIPGIVLPEREEPTGP